MTKMLSAIVKRLIKFLMKYQGDSILVVEMHKTSLMRREQNALLKEISENDSIQSVLNVGSVQEEGDKEGNKYKDYFKDKMYYTLDKNRKSAGDYHIMMDLEDLSKMDQKFDLVVNMSVMEHVKNPFKAAEQLSKVINKGGYLFISVPYFYPIHKDVHGRYSDYWRFTDDGIRALFPGLQEVWIRPYGSVISSVRDRNMYWYKELTPVGFGALLKKEF